MFSARRRSWHRFPCCALVAIGCTLLTHLPIWAQEAASATITLDRIMADPEWLGRQPEDAYWADDGQSIFYRRKRAGSQHSDWFQADLLGNVLQVVQPEDLGRMDFNGGHYNRDRTQKVFARRGDLFVKDLSGGKLRQLTQTVSAESRPRFMANAQRVMFRRGDAVYSRHLKSGLKRQLVDLRAEPDPKEQREKQREGFLPEQQQRLFEYLRKTRKEADAARELDQERQRKDPTRPPLPWYLGDSHQPRLIRVSPSGRWCLLSLAPKSAKSGNRDKLPEFVDAGGYVDVRDVRPLVGTGSPVSDRLLLLDLRNREQFELAFEGLPQYDEDPLAELKAAQQSAKPADESDQSPAAEANASTSSGDDDDDAKSVSKPGSDGKRSARAVNVSLIAWNDVGERAVVQLLSADNKDRWLAVVDLKEHCLRPLMHRRDPAWINWRLGRVGWLDQQTLFYSSEESGYAQLYVRDVQADAPRRLTHGDFVVSDVQPSLDGRYLYYTANVDHPGVYEAHRVNVTTGETEQLTRLGGMNRGQISPDQQHLLVTHSTALQPPELWIQPLAGEQEARQVTNTVSQEFQSLPWIKPRFVKIPSRYGRPIHARLYLPPGRTEDAELPAVLFIHGAGYLQNAHQGWSGYFREFMFHSLLAHRGYVVLDMDYRASAGYGRDWRTAIYRHMGGPEVEDLLDGKQWLVANQRVSGERVGLYGGSYGGFLTMMALFQHPGAFRCGAALRPVTDWAHYEHSYTSRILNTPTVDPEAYRRSSPIELAEGLADSLLICHGMVDDNVFFKDTARLAQRLIELRKENWEVAIYPVEPHGFVQPSSWYDEYRRILELLETHLK